MARPVQGIGVNEESLPSFRALLDLDDNAWNSFINKLESIYHENLEEAKLVNSMMESQIPGLTPVTLELIFEVGTSVHQLARDMDLKLDTVLDKVSISLERLLKSSEVSRRLRELVLSDAMWSLDKVRNVVSDNNFAFRGARVITELRPVFGKVVTEPPIAFAVAHSLKIDYVKDFKPGEFFVCLSNSEIDLMIEELQRAKQKAHTLRKTVKNTEIYMITDTEV